MFWFRFVDHYCNGVVAKGVRLIIKADTRHEAHQKMMEIGDRWDLGSGDTFFYMMGPVYGYYATREEAETKEPISINPDYPVLVS